MNRWFVAAMFLAVFPPAVTYWQKPPDGPVFISLPGLVESVEDVKVTDGSLLYGWNERRLNFKDTSGNSLSLVVNPLHRMPPKGDYCKVSYKEKWKFDFKGIEWRRSKVLISIEQL